MPYLSLSTWSLHRKLGPLYWTVWDDQKKTQQMKVEEQPEEIKLLDLPKIVRTKGFQAIEICHFHFPRTDEEYLSQLREACLEAGITFHTLLIDYGDLSAADDDRRQADLNWIKQWIDIAEVAGAERVRIIAGEADPEDQAALQRSIESLGKLTQYAKPLGVRIVTENFLSLTSTAANCLAIMQGTGGKIGIITDFGNFIGDDKYAELKKILPYSDSVHAKAPFDAKGRPDAVEFKQCLNLLPETNYKGPITLIYDGPGDMWQGIERVQKIVEPYL